MAQEIKRCSKCIIPTALPSVKLDDKGVCNYCRNYEAHYPRMSESGKSLKKREFEEKIDRAKKQKCHYDCVITYSGGKDSTYSLYLCSRVYGMKCLCITFDNGYLSDFARANIRSAIDATGADHIFYTLNRDTMLKLYRTSLIKAGILCAPCMKGIAVCVTIANKLYRTPLYIHGDSGKISYVGYPEISAAGEIFAKLIEGDPIADEISQWKIREMTRYVGGLYKRTLGKIFGVQQAFSFYEFFDVPREVIYNTIKNEMNWKAPPEDAEHMDCLLHEVPFYMHSLKFPEMTKKTTFLAGQVRFGEMTREEALEIENRERAQGKKPEILDSFLKELGMSEDEFVSHVRDWKKVDRYR